MRHVIIMKRFIESILSLKAITRSKYEAIDGGNIASGRRFLCAHEEDFIPQIVRRFNKNW